MKEVTYTDGDDGWLTVQIGDETAEFEVGFYLEAHSLELSRDEARDLAHALLEWADGKAQS